MIPFRSCLQTKKKKREKKKKKTIPFRENLLGSMKPFLGPIQFFTLGANIYTQHIIFFSFFLNLGWLLLLSMPLTDHYHTS